MHAGCSSRLKSRASRFASAVLCMGPRSDHASSPSCANSPAAHNPQQQLTLFPNEQTQSFFGQLSFMSILVLVTKCCPRSNSTLYYAMFLSVIDFGDTCSALTTDPIVASLGMTQYGDFTN